MGKRRTKETRQTTSTPTNPQFTTSAVSNLTNDANALRFADPQSFVAGASPLQTQAFSQAGALSLPDFAQSREIITDILGQGANQIAALDPVRAATIGAAVRPDEVTVDSASLLNDQGEFDVSPFFNPFLDQVIDATLSEFDVNADRTRARLAAQGAREDAFGGSRFGVAQGVLGGELNRNRALLDAGLRSQGFDAASDLALQEAGFEQQGNLTQAQIDAQQASQFASAQNQRNFNLAQLQQQANLANAENAFRGALANLQAEESSDARALQGASVLGDFDQRALANELTTINNLATLGAQERAIDQAQRQAPLDLLRTRAGILGSLPLNLFQGQDTNSTSQRVERSGVLGGLAGALSLVGGLANTFGNPLSGIFGGAAPTFSQAAFGSNPGSLAFGGVQPGSLGFTTLPTGVLGAR